jgi:hypothetical protein
MNNFSQQHEGPTPSFVVTFAQHAPLALFCACIGSFLILLILQANHDIAVWSDRMPSIGIFVGGAGALFVQVVRACGLLASTHNFSRGRAGIFAGCLSIILSICVSLYEHNHAAQLAEYYEGETDILSVNYITSFIQILVWIGAGLELIIISSTYGSQAARSRPQQQKPSSNGHTRDHVIEYEQNFQ